MLTGADATALTGVPDDPGLSGICLTGTGGIFSWINNIRCTMEIYNNLEYGFFFSATPKPGQVVHKFRISFLLFRALSMITLTPSFKLSHFCMANVCPTDVSCVDILPLGISRH